ncbi:MAG: TIGR03936 family radical SAM-associated protein [Ruminococcus sp.]|nr:TIGR03936 family radical SAM-associated protein [Ruminococcus sp.]
MIKIRTVFEKNGRAKYISHLDLYRFMLRAFNRSGLPIWYTEGYNPRPYITFALALSLGFESKCENMDFNLNEEVDFDEIKNRLNNVMPEGILFNSVAFPQKKITEIAFAEYGASIATEDSGILLQEFLKFMQKDSILVEKKTKKGMVQTDIKALSEITNVTQNQDSLDFNVRLPAGTQSNYNPMLLTNAFINEISNKNISVKICRNAIICSDGKKFF